MNVLRLIVLPSVLAVGALSLATSSAPAATSSSRCAQFVVGTANSTAYPGKRLPARGRATGVSCQVLRGVARAVQHGRPSSPSAEWPVRPDWSRGQVLRYRGQAWTCEGQTIAASGPSYRVRCDRDGRHLDWTTG